jgi:hypothetical protein
MAPIETNNFARLTGKLRIGTHAPTLAPIQMQVVLAHHPPDSIITDITQSFGNQTAIPPRKILWAALCLTDREFDVRRSHR